eukprot:GFUD01077632.1.p1 GENE.GFUD01077632.1~~GFUD01077632.1.p1  ORF type:complete len:532 (-),score=119.38 GFUD01077632.1:340-1935(-)
MLGFKLIILCSMFLCPILVESFTFPGDWHKIRQMMKTRRNKEELNENSGLGTRGNFGFSGGIKFQGDDDEEFDWNKFTFSTTTTTTPKPEPRPLEAVMESLMEDVNTTELLIRFGHLDGLSVRNAFGDFEETTPPPASFSASQSIWNFTMSMIKGGLKEQNTGNSLFSPVSILTTINMLLLGTKGSTRTEIMQALGYPRYTADVHAQFQSIINSMNRDIGVTVATSNALFKQVNFPVKESFKQELRKNYENEMEVVPLDFTRRPMTTLRRMNGFISKNTNNLIKNMFKEPVSADSKIVLSNALYFNASWEYEFLFDPPQFVGIDVDFDSFGKKIPATLMEATFDYPYYRDENLGLEIISLPYEHDVRNEEISEAHMFLMLPTEKGKQAFEDLENKLPNLDFQHIFEKMEVVFGDILLPRMEMEFTANLGPLLSGIGINKLFSGNPSEDFSPITDSWREFKLDTLQHKAVLRITEKGTEAAAATSAFQFRMIPSIVMQYDRPFFLFIYDALNKVVIFWARVVEPKKILENLD